MKHILGRLLAATLETEAWQLAGSPTLALAALSGAGRKVIFKSLKPERHIAVVNSIDVLPSPAGQPAFSVYMSVSGHSGAGG